MLTSKVADRLGRDIPEMSADELNITIGMVNDWAAEIASAPDPEAARKGVQTLREAIRAEVARRTPVEAGRGT